MIYDPFRKKIDELTGNFLILLKLFIKIQCLRNEQSMLAFVFLIFGIFQLEHIVFFGSEMMIHIFDHVVQSLFNDVLSAPLKNSVVQRVDYAEEFFVLIIDLLHFDAVFLFPFDLCHHHPPSCSLKILAHFHYNCKMSQTLRKLPKAELHRHLDGSVRSETIKELAALHGIDLGIRTEREFITKTKITSPMKDLRAVLDTFWTTQKVLCCYDAIKRVAFENVEDAFRDGVKLVELRFAPVFIAFGKDLKNDEIIEGVLDGITLGMNTYDIQVGIICILPRTYGLEDNIRATNDIIRYKKSYHTNASRICGFDLADSEECIDHADFVPLVDKARAAGLGITIHSGENTSAAYVDQTLSLYRPQRIGHGIKTADDKTVMHRVKELDIMLEICPTSNWLTNSVPSLKEHPLPSLYAEGVKVSINSDDPHIMDIDLVHEYELCTKEFGFTAEDFFTINTNTVETSFLDDDVKQFVLKRNFS